MFWKQLSQQKKKGGGKQRRVEARDRGGREGRGGERKERKHPTTTALDKESIYNISKTSSMALRT